MIIDVCFWKSKTEVLPLTLSAAVLDTVPYLLLAVQVNTPESSGKTSAMTKVQISSRGNDKKESYSHNQVSLVWLRHFNFSSRERLNAMRNDDLCFFVSPGLRVYLQLRQVEMICHGGLTQDERDYLIWFRVRGKQPWLMYRGTEALANDCKHFSTVICTHCCSIYRQAAALVQSTLIYLIFFERWRFHEIFTWFSWRSWFWNGNKNQNYYESDEVMV